MTLYCDKIKAGRAIINIQNRVNAERALLAAVVAERRADAALSVTDYPEASDAWPLKYNTWRDAGRAVVKASSAYVATLTTEPAEPLAYRILKPGALDGIAEPGQF